LTKDAEARRQTLTLWAASCVLGLVVFDETVVGVALPTMRHDLAMSELGSHWVVNAYLLTFTCFVAAGGRIGDLVDRRHVFAAGAGLFIIGSILAATAATGGMLIAARAVQGIGAAITFPASIAILTAAFPKERRGAAFAVQTTVAGLFMASGPLVGGVFSEVVSWRLIFWINVPVVFATALVLFRTVEPAPLRPDTARSDTARSDTARSDTAEADIGGADVAGFDVPGLLTMVIGIAGIVFALMQSSDWGWGEPVVLGPFLVGLALLAVFVRIEGRRSRPLVDLSLLRIPTFNGGNLIFAIFQFEKMAMFIFLALYLQQGLKRSPIEAGLTVTVAIVPTLITSRLFGLWRDRVGTRPPLLFALAVTALAILAIGYASIINSYPLVIGALIVWGAVMPGIAVPLRPAIMGGVPADKQGQASGINLSIQMLGGTLGIALASVLLTSTGLYWPVFILTGLATLAAAIIAWAMVERPAATR